ncbi:AAA family ATPase [Vreelandella massiliensis]|uniref:AAA family ATPase n=1 Tax=Vreelandella massiliensis TaxID=1816686 RepID=UPI001F2B6FAD|nr:AAA family ATPase [Halomonas massiliensis]
MTAMQQEQFHAAQKAFIVADTFGIDAPKGFAVNGFADPNHVAIPKSDDNYVFRKEPLREALAFLECPMNTGLFISGHKGTGKTSLITEVCARLNWPVQQITCTSRTEMTDLVGYHAMMSTTPGAPPEMQFQYGPLALAMKEGHVLVLNEIDMMEPAELTGLNDILEGRPLVIAQNAGEVIHPHPAFRIVATANSMGNGDETGQYAGITMQNMAAMDRYRFMTVDYPHEDVEAAILAKVAPELGEAIHKAMIGVANEVREVFKGEQTLSVKTEYGEESVAMSEPISTRKMVLWAQLAVQFRSSTNAEGERNALSYALHIAHLRRLNDYEREAILQLCNAIFPEWHD